MNLLIRNLYTVLFILISFSGIFSQDCKSLVRIFSDEQDVNVVVDGKEISNTDSIYLGEGKYHFEIYENTGKWNPDVISDTVIINNNCDTISLHYKLKSEKIFLKSDPSNAKVFVNDSLLGYTPLHLSANFQYVLLTKQNYSDKLISLNQIRNLQPVELEYVGNGPDNKFYGSTKFIILVSTAVALGAATAYYKLEADRKFDEYQLTGDPALLDKTDKFDLISGITFSALQINFGAIIYFFFTE